MAHRISQTTASAALRADQDSSLACFSFCNRASASDACVFICLTAASSSVRFAARQRRCYQARSARSCVRRVASRPCRNLCARLDIAGQILSCHRPPYTIYPSPRAMPMLVFQTCAVHSLACEGLRGCPDNGKGKLPRQFVDSKGPGSDRTFLLAFPNLRNCCRCHERVVII
jgi:hypothetical protein